MTILNNESVKNNKWKLIIIGVIIIVMLILIFMPIRRVMKENPDEFTIMDDRDVKDKVEKISAKDKVEKIEPIKEKKAKVKDTTPIIAKVKDTTPIIAKVKDTTPIIAKKKIIPKIDNTPCVKPRYQFPGLDDKIRKILSEKKTDRKTRCSKAENICRKVLEEVFYGEKFPNTRPKWLRNPKTKRCLELDCWNPRLNIALEYNGIQHYVYPNFTGCTYEQFANQVARDEIKIKECEARKIKLIIVPYNINYSDIKDYIFDELKSKGIDIVV